MIAIVAATAAGRAHAEHLARALPDAHVLDGRPRQALERAFLDSEGIVCCLAVGAAVRLVAPLLAGKDVDPGVVCVDDAGRFAVALVGGHEGGANALALRVAAALGCEPVITTATDTLGLPALDALGVDLGFRLEPGGAGAAVGGALVSGRPVRLLADRRWPLPPLPANVGEDAPGDAPAIVISDRERVPGGRAVVYRPPSLVVGVGASRGAGAGEILALIDAALAAAGLSARSVSALATADVKAGEPGILEAAERRGWPLVTFAAEALAAVAVPNPSEAVRQAVGTPSVAEAAALLAAAQPARLEELREPPQLLVPKRKSAMATAAVARRPVRGRLALVSLGPGDVRLLPPLAREALAGAQLVVGYSLYLDQVRGLLRPGTEVVPYALGEEVERCRFAIEQASRGASVALVSSGDVGVYAMASPALEEGGLGHVEVTVVPGITAAHAAAALVGSPLGHDHCAISLSDLLTPWGAIERRLRAAADGDFVVSLYNPRSRARDWQLDRARELLLERRPAATPVALVTDAYRPAQQVTLSTLAGFDSAAVAMTTVVVIGSSHTRIVEGRMVTPRGYRAPRREESAA